MALSINILPVLILCKDWSYLLLHYQDTKASTAPVFVTVIFNFVAVVWSFGGFSMA
jgi:hypothetical protein